MLPNKSCSFKVFVTNISLLKYHHKHFPFEVLPQMLQQRLVGLSQTSQQRLFTIVAAKGFSQMLQQKDFHKCCSKRLFTNVAANIRHKCCSNVPWQIQFFKSRWLVFSFQFWSVIKMSFGLLWEIFPPLSVQFNIHTHLSTIQGRYPTARVLAKSGAANGE